MKKITLAIILLFSSLAYAETKLTIGGEAKLGTDIESYNSFFDIELSLNLYFWKCKWSAYAGNRVWFVLDFPDNSITGYPFRNIYFYGSRFRIAGFFVDFQHFCNHAVKSNALHTDAYGYENQQWRSNFWGETITTISIGYEFEFTIFKK